MTDTIDHIICGGAGTSLGDKTIEIYDHTILNVAVNLKHAALAEHYESQGTSHEHAHRKAMKLGRKIQRFFDDLYADLQDDDVPVHTYEPHAQNFG